MRVGLRGMATREDNRWRYACQSAHWWRHAYRHYFHPLIFILTAFSVLLTLSILMRCFYPNNLHFTSVSDEASLLMRTRRNTLMRSHLIRSSLRAKMDQAHYLTYWEMLKELQFLLPTTRLDIFPYLSDRMPLVGQLHQKFDPSRLEICATPGVNCKAILTSGTNLAVTVTLDRAALERNRRVRTNIAELNKTGIITHYKHHADFLERYMGLSTELMPYFCQDQHRNISIIWKSRYVLLPAKPCSSVERFLEFTYLASDCLDVGVVLEGMKTSEVGVPILHDDTIRGVVFPTANVSFDILRQYYCRNIPIFLPRFDVEETLRSGENKTGTDEACRAVGIHKRHIGYVNSDVWSEFPMVITYNSFYDLVEKLSVTNVSAIALRMREENENERVAALKVWRTIIDRLL